MKIFTLIIIFMFLYNNSFSQENKKTVSDKPYFQLESIHFDITSLIYLIDLSISSDFEIYKTDLQSFGVQTGYSFLVYGSPGGSNNDSPFHDVNLLAYSSIGYSAPITTQLIIGYTYRISSKSVVDEYPVSGLKLGISFNLNLGKYFRIYLKYSGLLDTTKSGMSAVGLGLSVGWAR